MLPQALFISDDLAPILIGVTVLFFLLLVSILLFFMFFIFRSIGLLRVILFRSPYLIIYTHVYVCAREGVVSVAAGLSPACAGLF